MKMKTRNLIFASVLMLAPLAGCSDATAKLNDAKTTLITVGDSTITKGDVYNLLKSSSGATTAVNDANRAIAAAEVEVTDEMKSDAQNTLSSYKSLYGDSFSSYIEQNGMTEEDYLNNYLIPSLQAEKLVGIYIDENWDDVKALYQPIKATILTFTSKDDADAALNDINGGTDPAEAASSHNSSSSATSTIYTLESSDVDSLVRTAMTSNKPEDGWKMVPESDGATYALLRVDDNDADNFKDEAKETLSKIDNVTSASTTYFFRKYKFHIYDKVIYDAVESDYPNNFVQNMTDEQAGVSASAEAE
jgi:foldase protein PrsA